MKLSPWLIALSLVSHTASADAVAAHSCLNLEGADAVASVSGKLTVQLFAGPPNFESIAKGDAEEQAFILELPKRICASDGEFIESSTPFDRVHVSSDDPGIIKVLSAAVGRNVTVSGEAFGSHTGHHHAPLVMLVTTLTVR